MSTSAEDQKYLPPKLSLLDVRGKEYSYTQLRALMPRQSSEYVGNAQQTVEEIISGVKNSGADYIRELAERFDGVHQRSLRVPESALEDALERLDSKVRAALEISIERNRTFAQAQRPQDTTIEVAPGAQLTNRWTPVRRVGLYVPGGLAVYPSSVIMNAVPAQAAGVESIVLCSPPQKEFDGLPHPTILAAAALLGIREVWAIGGAQALAAMAYGIEDIDDELTCVDTITGPGNIFVALAKRALQGVVGVDGEAGTTEIAVIADESAHAEYVAADLISQAEHDPNAGSILITDSLECAEQVSQAIARQSSATKHRDRVKTALEGPQSGIILTDSLEQSIRVADAYAAEHLEIHTKNPAEVAQRVRNAGAIFIGPYSPVPLGDYAAGSNHVLPTSGTASFASGLNTSTFMKVVQLIEYSQPALEDIGDHIVTLAQEEDLPAHGEAINIRSMSDSSESGGKL
ncbi:histidinol dehydrogenase [Rothia sp. CCM 9418]|uniref:histidinol dehydrogenase n=1 Tax=Rothia sp. CCM 9418 TaxID=3402661 RepID=UPI003AE92D4B